MKKVLILGILFFVIAGLATHSGQAKNLATTECGSPYVEICLNNTLQMGGGSGGSGQGRPAMLSMKLF
jgi:hypothetical protein